MMFAFLLGCSLANALLDSRTSIDVAAFALEAISQYGMIEGNKVVEAYYAKLLDSKNARVISFKKVLKHQYVPSSVTNYVVVKLMENGRLAEMEVCYDLRRHWWHDRKLADDICFHHPIRSAAYQAYYHKLPPNVEDRFAKTYVEALSYRTLCGDMKVEEQLLACLADKRVVIDYTLFPGPNVIGKPPRVCDYGLSLLCKLYQVSFKDVSMQYGMPYSLFKNDTIKQKLQKETEVAYDKMIADLKRIRSRHFVDYFKDNK